MKIFELKSNHGLIDGFVSDFNPNNNSGKVAVIVNGLNGFATYGMFPQIQNELQSKGIASVAINFSHGGVRGSSDVFTEIDLYENNSMRLEVLDTIAVVDNLEKIGITDYNELYLISHSLGSIPTAFAAKEIIKHNKKLKGIAFIAPSMNLDFWGDENMQKWEQAGKLENPNKRTNQILPLGKEFLTETKESSTTWNLENALSSTKVRYAIFHGDKDESIPIEEAHAVNEWNQKHGNPCNLYVVENANHNFNISHPYQHSTPEFEKLIELLTKWILA